MTPSGQQPNETDTSSALQHEDIETSVPEVSATVGGLRAWLRRRKTSVAPENPVENRETPAEGDRAVPSTDAGTLKTPEDEPVSTAYQTLAGLLSDEALTRQRADITSRMQRNPQFASLWRIERAAKDNRARFAEARKNHDKAHMESLEEAFDDLWDEKLGYDAHDRAAYEQLAAELTQAESRSYRVTPHDEAGRIVLDLLAHADPIHPAAAERAPFADYAANDEQSWKLVPKVQVKDYMAQRLPMPFEKYGPPTEQGRVIVEGPEPFEVPSDLIVRLAGFDDWLGRSPLYGKEYTSPYGNGKMSSFDVIRHYASMPTELPPASVIRVMIQPDGKIMCDNEAGDSHRIAAAIARGDKTVRADTLHFQLLTHNIM